MGETKLPSLNKVLIVGNLTRDPELRYTSNGVPVANFRIACNKRYRDNLGAYKEDVCYIGVVAWQRLAENCNEFLKKGSAVLVEGELQSKFRENEDGSKRHYVEIKAYQIQFLDREKKQEVPDWEKEEVMDLDLKENQDYEGWGLNGRI